MSTKGFPPLPSVLRKRTSLGAWIFVDEDKKGTIKRERDSKEKKKGRMNTSRRMEGPHFAPARPISPMVRVTFLTALLIIYN